MALQVSLLGGIGMIPSWYFDTNPETNRITINPHVRFPDGMNQLTVQPVGRWATSGDADLQGLRGARSFGTPMIAPEVPPVGIGPTPLRGLGLFDSAWWTQRKWIALGVLGALGAGAAVIATKYLR